MNSSHKAYGTVVGTLTPTPWLRPERLLNVHSPLAMSISFHLAYRFACFCCRRTVDADPIILFNKGSDLSFHIAAFWGIRRDPSDKFPTLVRIQWRETPQLVSHLSLSDKFQVVLEELNIIS